MGFSKGDRVIYIPNHAYGDINHADCEAGEVEFSNEKFVFVTFDNDPPPTQYEIRPKAVSADNLVLEPT